MTTAQSPLETGIGKYFAELTDPRINRRRRHKLIDIVVISICAVICRAESWKDIKLWADTHEDWLGRFLELPNGVPSRDTFRRVISRLNPQEFQKCFMEWIRCLVPTTDGRIVAIDGKTVRRSMDGEERGLSVAYDFRGVDHVHLLLSASAVTELMGPGYGWTEETGRLLTNAIAWIRDVKQPLPDAPTLGTDADDIGTVETIEVFGQTPFRSAVSVLRDGEVVATAEPDRDGTWAAEVTLVEGENVLVAEASNFAGSAVSEPLTVWLDTTGPVLDWTPPDMAGFLDPVVTVAGTAHDEPAGVAEVAVNGMPVEVDGDGAWSTEVEVAEGGTTITVVATDTLGNETVETRTVAYVPLAVEWEVPPQPSRAINVRLHVTDLDGVPTEVDRALLEAHAEDGTVSGPFRMRWSEDRYHHVLRRLESGDHQLVANLEIDGFAVTIRGPHVTAL
jgi:hypothetical protein